MPDSHASPDRQHSSTDRSPTASAPIARSLAPCMRRTRAHAALSRHVGRRLEIALLACAVLLTLGCAPRRLGASALRATSSGTSTPALDPGAPVPAFHEWRAAYLGQDGHLHFVTLDGKSDLAGPRLPGMDSRQPDLGLWNGGISPDGRSLAFTTTELAIIDLAAPTSPHMSVDAIGGLQYDVMWSPDGSRLAFDGGSGISVVRVDSAATPTALPNAQAILSHPLVGWIDATHLAYLGVRQGGEQSASNVWLDAVDVTTDQVREIAAIPSALIAGEHLPNVTLSPDGRQAVLSNVSWRDYTPPPLIEVVDTSTGQYTPLPNISRLTNATWDAKVAWQSGTETLAATTYGYGYGYGAGAGGASPRIWIVDLAHDAATPLAGSNGYNALGWAPDNGPLIVGTSNATQLESDPHTLAAVTPVAAGQTRFLTLTHTAVSFPFIGFVRTAQEGACWLERAGARQGGHRTSRPASLAAEVAVLH